MGAIYKKVTSILAPLILPTVNQLLPGAGRMFKALWDLSECILMYENTTFPSSTYIIHDVYYPQLPDSHVRMSHFRCILMLIHQYTSELMLQIKYECHISVVHDRLRILYTTARQVCCLSRRSQDQFCSQKKSLDSLNSLRIRILRDFFKVKRVIS